ncbi:PH domain-containing protein [Janibacter massiliensis]|uniref:PH domain-containing protein n=1 Tax=Janibacter massiliensis TaxID=2058291 RepID=UPI000D0E9664|nr:PH domain-containing protein [Janibacter massiliensis]
MAKRDKHVEAAREHLEQGEQIQAAVAGAYETTLMGSKTSRNGALIATDRRVLFFAKKIGGYDLESFPYSNISSFEQSKGMMGHTLTFFASGNKVTLKWISEVEDLAGFVQVTKARLVPASAPPAGPAPAPATAPAAAPATPAPADPAAQIMDQLRQLGELRDAGILTDDEFSTKKAELLARL